MIDGDLWTKNTVKRNWIDHENFNNLNQKTGFAMAIKIDFRLAGMIIAVILCGSSDAQQIVRKPELESYLANRNKFPEYSCAMLVEYVQNYPDPDLCFFRDEWYIHCISDKEKKQRFEFLPLFNSRAPEIAEGGHLLFVFNGEVLPTSHGSLRPLKGVDLANLQQDQDTVAPAERCNPFEVPFFESGNFSKKSVYYLRSDSLMRAFERFGKTAEESLPEGVLVKYRITPQYEVFTEVLFHEKVGGMPILNVLRDPPRSTKTTKMEWFDTGKGWLPKRAIIDMSFGDPKKPDSSRQWDVTFYWMLSLPNKVWETDYRKKGLLPSQLREIIIANAIKMK